MSAPRHLVVVGGSAGGVEALRVLVRQLPAELPAAVAVVVHGGSSGDDRLAVLVSRWGQLEATMANDGEAIKGSHIYVAPNGRHLVIDDSHLRLSFAAEENRARPSIDVLFRSAATQFGANCIGVILSGALDDGSAGLNAIREAGGRTLVQDPREALFPEMPTNAISYALPRAVLPVVELAHEIVRFVSDPSATRGVVMRADDRAEAEEDAHETERVSSLTCPQCHGAVWEREVGGLLQYRCRTGHVFGQDTMVSEQDRMVEDALWAAVRALEERSAMSRRLAERFELRGDGAGAARCLRQAAVAKRRADTLRATVLADDDDPG